MNIHSDTLKLCRLHLPSPILSLPSPSLLLYTHLPLFFSTHTVSSFYMLFSVSYRLIVLHIVSPVFMSISMDAIFAEQSQLSHPELNTANAQTEPNTATLDKPLEDDMTTRVKYMKDAVRTLIPCHGNTQTARGIRITRRYGKLLSQLYKIHRNLHRTQDSRMLKYSTSSVRI